MSQSGNPLPQSDSQMDLPPFDRPHWNLWRTAFELAASIGLVSGVIQIEQRLFPTLLDQPAWLAPVVYIGAICLPLARLFCLIGLEVRCVWNRARWYGEVHRHAVLLTAEIARLRVAATTREQLIAEQSNAVERLTNFVEHTQWLAPNLHRAMIGGAVHEDGRLILIAESDFALGVVAGDTFMVVGQEPMAILGDFRFTKQSERGYHLRAVSIRDNLWWAVIRQAGESGMLAVHQLVAILAPSPRLDLE